MKKLVQNRREDEAQKQDKELPSDQLPRLQRQSDTSPKETRTDSNSSVGAQTVPTALF